MADIICYTRGCRAIRVCKRVERSRLSGVIVSRCHDVQPFIGLKAQQQTLPAHIAQRFEHLRHMLPDVKKTIANVAELDVSDKKMQLKFCKKALCKPHASLYTPECYRSHCA